MKGRPDLSRLTHVAAQLWQRGLPAHARLTLRVRWPLAALAAALAAQLAMPDPVWTTTAVALALLYGGALLWARALARGVTLERSRTGSLIVAGDTLDEHFALANSAGVPVIWAEFIDESDLPGYAVGRVAAVEARGVTRWRTQGLCAQRGVYRLGPHRLELGDPLHLFALTLRFDQSDAILIYPRVARLPAFPLPRGYAEGAAAIRRPLLGALPAASVRAYLPQDPLRFVHWPSSARHGTLMVRELEQEPSGAIWIVLDTHAAAQRRQGERATLETGVTAAAGLAAQFLEGSGRRAVGFVAADAQGNLVTVPPAAGRGHLWRILGALAPLRAGPLPLADLLHGLRALTGGRSSLVVVTPELEGAGVDGWTAQLVRLAESGLAAGLLPITTDATAAAAEALRPLLAAHAIPMQPLAVDAPLAAALTHRRRRTVLRTTPQGRTFAVEIEEEVA